VVKVINGGDNSIDSKNKNLGIRAIHIYGGMGHNLVRYAKYESYGHIEILGCGEFTRETNHSRKDFFGHW
jgi:hypothetical protein